MRGKFWNLPERRGEMLHIGPHDLGYGPLVVGCCEHSNKPMGSMKGRKFD